MVRFRSNHHNYILAGNRITYVIFDKNMEIVDSNKLDIYDINRSLAKNNADRMNELDYLVCDYCFNGVIKIAKGKLENILDKMVNNGLLIKQYENVKYIEYLKNFSSHLRGTKK